jgi:hypothetical protein
VSKEAGDMRHETGEVSALRRMRRTRGEVAADGSRGSGGRGSDRKRNAD